MSPIPSISGAAQYGVEQLKLQMARRNAEQAEQTAQALRMQANQAQRVAERAKENARSLSIQSDQADRRAGIARQGLAALQSSRQAVGELSRAVGQALDRQSAQPAVSEAPSPVVNAQGQLTGTTINTIA